MAFFLFFFETFPWRRLGRTSVGLMNLFHPKTATQAVSSWRCTAVWKPETRITANKKLLTARFSLLCNPVSLPPSLPEIIPWGGIISLLLPLASAPWMHLQFIRLLSQIGYGRKRLWRDQSRRWDLRLGFCPNLTPYQGGSRRAQSPRTISKSEHIYTSKTQIKATSVAVFKEEKESRKASRKLPADGSEKRKEILSQG